MFNVRLAGGHLYGKQLFTWLSLVVSLMASFVLSFFPLDVLDEIWDLIESVSEGFLTYSLKYLAIQNLRIGSTHLVWRNMESSVTDVRKGVTKARILTGTYILQKQRHSSSRGTVLCMRYCQLEEEDLLHMFAQCQVWQSYLASYITLVIIT